ncbi:MAG: aminopeptidase P family protein [Clostridia bacterium]|nr:aminopeptidase P family protein [Clostridia bacterium]
MEDRLVLNRSAFDAVRKDYRRAMSEVDIKKIITDCWATSGRDIEFSGDVVSGARSGSIEGDATDYIPKDGDALILDLQPGWDHFWCDTTRTFFIGEPSEKQRFAFDAVSKTLSRLQKLLKPGKRACDIYAAMQDSFAEFGLSCPHHAGHATGSEKVKHPCFVEECTDCLEEGMYVALEPGVYFEGEFGIRLENNYLITENGSKELFGYTLDINNFII